MDARTKAIRTKETEISERSHIIKQIIRGGIGLAGVGMVAADFAITGEGTATRHFLEYGGAATIAISAFLLRRSSVKRTNDTVASLIGWISTPPWASDEKFDEVIRDLSHLQEKGRLGSKKKNVEGLLESIYDSKYPRIGDAESWLGEEGMKTVSLEKLSHFKKSYRISRKSK